jgi:hypothetical protein
MESRNSIVNTKFSGIPMEFYAHFFRIPRIIPNNSKEF